MDIAHYRQTLEQPWGKIFYEILFDQLKEVKGQTVLDFGAGFCLTADFLAKNNDVTAIEPSSAMLHDRENSNLTKLLGSIEALAGFPDGSFDLILCHNVLEYVAVDQRATYLEAFARLLKPGGSLSVVKHHQAGKVMQAVVFGNQVDTALALLAGGAYQSPSFSEGRAYDMDDLAQASGLTIERYQGIRTFYALQPNEVKAQEGWLENLTRMELAVCDLAPYKDISFFHHVWLRKAG